MHHPDMPARAVAVAVATVLLASTVHPCSTFCLARNGEVVFGRNYDFQIGDGAVLINARGLQKKSTRGTRSWASRYGSVTFNQFGRETPMDGMNEAGLVIALMWLDGTVYPKPDERPALGVLEWIQYHLDNYRSVAEVLANVEKTRIEGRTPLHYLIGDSTGAAATIEYLDGSLVVHTGDKLPVAVLTNSTYASSLAHMRGTATVPGGPGSLDRFARAASQLRKIPPKAKLRDEAFQVLGSVTQTPGTRWSIVYGVTARQIHWRTDASPSVKTVRLRDLDFSCAAGDKRIDVNIARGGDLTTAFQDEKPADNLALMVQSYAGTSFLRNVPRTEIAAEAAHAESFACAR